ncbi:MAG TPA: hypothetical protein VFX60_14315 [Micromonospora sp.]|nr:hypothetical protein [Micromonospora sp.]
MISLTRVERPPVSWRALTLAVFGFAAVHVIMTVVAIVVLVQDYQLVKRLGADQSRVSDAEIDAMLHLQSSVGPVISLAFLAYIGAFIAWYVVTGKTVGRYGGDRKRVLSHWTLTAWRVTVVVFFLTGVLMRSSTATESIDLDGAVSVALEYDRIGIFREALRFPMAALLVGGVLVVARRVSDLIANPPSRDVDYRPEEVSLGTPVLSRPAIERGPGDNAYWQQVAEAVARSSGPLPLLEAWAAAAGCRRWYLLADTSEIDAVRASLSAWSGITVYGVPPCPPDEAVLSQLADEARRLRDDSAAGGAIGLIEEEGGKLRFEQLRSEEELLSWLDRARTASRVGVYPVQAAADPAALISA